MSKVLEIAILAIVTFVICGGYLPSNMPIFTQTSAEGLETGPILMPPLSGQGGGHGQALSMPSIIDQNSLQIPSDLIPIIFATRNGQSINATSGEDNLPLILYQLLQVQSQLQPQLEAMQQLQLQQLAQLQQSQQLLQQQLLLFQSQRQWYSHPDFINSTDSTMQNKTVPGTTVMSDALVGSLQSLQQSQQLLQQQLAQLQQSQQLQQQQLLQLQQSLGRLQSMVIPSTNTTEMAVNATITTNGQYTSNQSQELSEEPVQPELLKKPEPATPTPVGPSSPSNLTTTPSPSLSPVGPSSSSNLTTTPPATPPASPTPAPKFAANGTVNQSSALSEQKPINGNAGGNFLGVVKINASREQAPENVAVNVLDTNQNTRWSGQGNGTWIQADLGSEKPIKSVGIAWYKGASRQYNFEISVSNTTEEKDFVKVFTGLSSGTTDSTERYDTKGIQGQYLRIIINGNTDSKTSSRDWASITTLEPYSLEPSFESPVQPVASLEKSSPNLYG
jgi:hypothetical protein